MQRMLSLIAMLAVAGCMEPATNGAPNEAPSTVSQAASTEPLRVCSWNMRRLGHDFDHRPKDMETAAEIITDHCDVIAVQEVMQRSGGRTPGHVDLSAALGDAWSGIITEEPRPNTTSSNAEHHAFYFRRSAVSLCPTWDGARIVSDPPDAFLREPAWACFVIAGRQRELLLASYHAIYGSLVERRREVTLLDDDLDGDGEVDDVMTEIRASRPHDADVIVVGDFNLSTNDLKTVLPGFADLTQGTGSTLNLHDGVTTNLFDHALVENGDADTIGATAAAVLDVRSYATDDSFYRSVSDHLPIRFFLNRATPQVSGRSSIDPTP